MGRKEREVNQTVLHKGNTRYLKSITDPVHSNLEASNQSLVWKEELGSQDIKPWIPQGPGPGAKYIDGFRKWAELLLHTLKP